MPESNLSNVKIEFGGDKAKFWSEIEGQVRSVKLPPLHPGPKDSIASETDDLEIVFEETAEGKIYEYFVFWMRQVEQEVEEGVAPAQGKKRAKRFVVLPDDIAEASVAIKFAEREIVHRFKHIYPVQIAWTDLKTASPAALALRVRFHAELIDG